MADLVTGTVAGPRFNLTLLSAFAFLALALAAVGTYGVVSYGVAQRTREIGLRMALGARPSQVLASVVGQGLGLAAAGVALGLAGSFAAARLMEGLLYGVTATDPAALAGAAACSPWSRWGPPTCRDDGRPGWIRPPCCEPSDHRRHPGCRRRCASGSWVDDREEPLRLLVAGS